MACKWAARRTGEYRACEECGKEFYAAKNRIEKGDGHFCSIQCHNLTLTRYNASRGMFISKPERAVGELLDSLGIEYIPQATIDRLVCDFLVPDCRLVIEVDGDYWHNLPEQKERDRRRDWFLRRHGFSVLRIWVSDFESDPIHISNVILLKLRKRRAFLVQRKARSSVPPLNPVLA